MKFKIYPYKIGSASAKSLADGLDAKRVRVDGQYVPYRNHVVINWGSGKEPEWLHRNTTQYRYLNRHEEVLRVGNKLLCFKDLQRWGVSIPRFTESKEEASSWGVPIVIRHKLRGHSGDGAVYTEDVANLPDAPLYVEYKKKVREFRVHVFRERVIDVQEKKKRREVGNDEVDYKIRNKYTGWVYCRDIDAPPPSISDDSILAVSCCGLDFGAVDVIWNNHEQKSYILEINTAPGLEGQTLTNYVEAFKQYAVGDEL